MLHEDANTPETTASAESTPEQPATLETALAEIAELREYAGKLEAAHLKLSGEQDNARITFFPSLLTQQQRGALSQKYSQKYVKMHAERAAHQTQFPDYANDTAMLYVLTQCSNEANDKIAADLRDSHVSNLYTMVTGYTLAEVLTEYQVKRNTEVDREIKELVSRIGDNHREHVNILGAVRKYWLKSFDTGYRDAMDKKLRRAAHIFGVAQAELE